MIVRFTDLVCMPPMLNGGIGDRYRLAPTRLHARRSCAITQPLSGPEQIRCSDAADQFAVIRPRYGALAALLVMILCAGSSVTTPFDML